MQSFVSRHQHQIQGTLIGFDRLRFVGLLLRLSYLDGLAGFLAVTGVLPGVRQLYVRTQSAVKHASERLAQTTVSGHVHYLGAVQITFQKSIVFLYCHYGKFGSDFQCPAEVSRPRSVPSREGAATLGRL